MCAENALSLVTNGTLTTSDILPKELLPALRERRFFDIIASRKGRILEVGSSLLWVELLLEA
jgi:hypothetical protein